MDRWLINGVRSSALAADDRGLAYGDGLFETLAVRAGKCRFIEFHLDRLTESCVRLGIPFEADNSLRKEIAAFIAGEVHGIVFGRCVDHAKRARISAGDVLHQIRVGNIRPG